MHTPKFAGIEAHFRALIEDGTLTPGQRLPTDAQLREQFGVSHNTARAALLGLRARGLVHGRRGLGVFVTDPQAQVDALASAPGTQYKFAAIVAYVKAQIASGQLKAGDPLPPYKVMQERFGAKFNAVREAILVLEAQGYVEKSAGEGARVKSNPSGR